MKTKFARRPWAFHRMALVTALAGLVSHVAWGGPGDVDPSFADGGFFTSEELSGSANSILAPGDGTYIVSGGYTRGSFWAPQEIYTAGFLRRLTTAGTLDPVETLGGREVLTTILQPDQTIVGIARESRLYRWQDSAFGLQPDGTLDTGFGSGGWVALAFSGGTSFRPRPLSLMSPALTVEPGGGITFAGRLGDDLLVSRVLPDGAFDRGFAVDGTFVGLAVGPAQNSIARTPAGGYRVLTRDQLETGSRCRVLALTQGGVPDADFGSGGYADLETPAEVSASCSNVIELADGRLLAVGTENGRAFAIRLLADGAVDPTFSSADIAETAGSLQKAVVDGKGRIVVVGRGRDGVAGAVVARLQNDGTLDQSFGNGGSTWVDVGGYASVRDIAVLTGNAILIAGAAVREGPFALPGRPFVARLLGDGGGDGSTVLGFKRPRMAPAAEGLPAVVAVRRTGGRVGAVSVSYRTSEATESGARAIEGDYTPVSGELRWDDGDFSDREILVPIAADADLGEEQETLLIQLEDPAGGARLGTGSAIVQIGADGAPAGLFTIETIEEWGIGAWERNEFVQVQVARNYYRDGAVSVTVTPESGSAVAGEDFAPDGVTVSWADGEWGIKEVQLPIENDAEEEGSEEFTVKLTNATAGAIGARSTALIRIDDDDSPAQQEPPPVEPPSVNPGTSGGGGQTGWLPTMLLLYLAIVRRRVRW